MNANRVLLLLLLVALALRLGWSLSRPGDDAAIDQLPDQREYLELGRSLLHGEGLSFSDPRFVDRVYAYRTPGYPLLIAACGANVRAVRVVQSVLDVSAILAAYLLARRWLSPAACVFAVLLLAFDPFLIYFTSTVLTETLFTAMLAWGLFLLTRRSTIAYFIGGLLLALAVLVRPGAIALPVVLGVLAALVNRREQPPYHSRWPLPVGTTMLLLTLIVLTPWAYRNHRVVGRWIWTSTNGGITSYDGFNPDASGASDQSFVKAMPQLRSMSEAERDEYLASRASEFIRTNPQRAMELAVIKVARTWSPRPLSEQFSRPTYVIAASAFAVPFFLLAVIGLFGRGTMPASAKVLLIAPAVYLTVAAAASVGSLRYRIPAEVPMAVIAAAAPPVVLGRERASHPF